MTEKITLNNLTVNTVEVIKQAQIKVNGFMENVGLPHQKVYHKDENMNELQQDLNGADLAAVLTMWGSIQYTIKGDKLLIT